MSQPDVVFVGTGHNALACACHLAGQGWRVEMFEQAATPGGAIKSGEYTVPGFRHDWAAMNLSLFAGSRFHTKNAEDLARYSLAFAPIANPFSSAFPDGRWLGIPNDQVLNAARIRGFSDADAQAWTELTESFGGQAEQIIGLLGSPMKLRAFASFAWKAQRKLGTAASLDLACFLTMSSRVWLDETFTSPEVKALLAVWGMHLDFAPDVAGGAVFPYLEGLAGQAFGMLLGQGGADVMIKAMVGLLEERGGKVQCNTPVAEILHSGGTAKGVRLADGRDVTAKRAVIANVAPKAMVKLTGGTGDASYDKKLSAFQHAPGTMVVHLALDKLPNWKAPELKRFSYVHLAVSSH